MKTYSEFRPTSFDQHIEVEGIEDWLVLPVTQNRDSEVLARANWEAAVAQLNELDSDDWDIHRFGHWANGWFEIIVVKPDTLAHRIAENIERSLEDYPILDEELLSRMEFEEREQEWDNWVRANFERALEQKLEAWLEEFTNHEGYPLYEEDTERVRNVHRFIQVFEDSPDLRELYATTEPPDEEWDVERAISKIDYNFLLKFWPDPEDAKDERQVEMEL